ncbi:hypothetical protein ACIOD1_03975 [Streptomyces sp. NPDC088097]|uniref:hypothetical protein n=1 Tax=Streptomyces sp. NPDC088097 TaxID=3365823 RepID=UPI003801DFFB
MRGTGGSRGSSGEWEKPFWQQRGWLISAAFLLAMFLIGGFVLLTGEDTTGDTGQPAPSQPTASGPPATTPSATPPGSTEGRPAGCSTNDSDQNVPTQSPADLQWKQSDTDLLPVSDSLGPRKFDGPLWSCYAHTPTGAVLAVHGISTHFTGPRWREVADRQMARGAGRDEFIKKRGSLPADQTKKGAPGSNGTYAGFSVLSYSATQATVMLLIQLPEKGYASGTASVVWEDGDWKLRPTLTGSLLEGVASVTGTDGFIIWGGGNAG